MGVENGCEANTICTGVIHDVTQLPVIPTTSSTSSTDSTRVVAAAYSSNSYSTEHCNEAHCTVVKSSERGFSPYSSPKITISLQSFYTSEQTGLFETLETKTTG